MINNHGNAAMENTKPPISATENLDKSPESVVFESFLDGMGEYFRRNPVAMTIMNTLDSKHSNVAMDNTAVLYVSYSDYSQRRESIEVQIRACEEFAKQMNLQIVGQYTDTANSETTSGRESFLQMIADSAKDKFRYLIIHKADMLSSSNPGVAIYKKKLEMNGVTILSATENLDNSPESVLLESLVDATIEHLRLNLARAEE